MWVVTDIKDTSFWKQFTTHYVDDNPETTLLLISKIPHFESNSQRGGIPFLYWFCCYWYQRYLILKAIHNDYCPLFRLAPVVTDIKDTSFWKQFTTRRLNESFGGMLLLISKIPHFESNSQHKKRSYLIGNCCYWYQRYLILKAIHNLKGVGQSYASVVTDIKDTSFWKQFTTNSCHSLEV